MTTRKDLPSEKSANFQQRLRETLQTYLGRQGDPLDRGVTLRDLVESGIAKLPSWWSGGSGVAPIEPGDPIRNPEDPELDLTPPPTPTGFEATGLVSAILIQHDDPVFLSGGGYLSTIVYGVTREDGDPAPTFSDAVQIHEFQGGPSSYATNPATTWHLWIKWKSQAGVLSAAPAGGTNGVVARTAVDVGKLLEALTGEITESQLYQDLGDRINLIDGPEALDGSVAQRVAAEAAARSAEIQAEAAARIADVLAAENQADAALTAAVALLDTDIATETSARIAADTAEATARADAITAEANARIAGISQEATTRANELFAEASIRSEQTLHNAQLIIDSALAMERINFELGETIAVARQTLNTEMEAGFLAESTARLLLATQVEDNTAAIVSEQTARSTADEAFASDITALVARTTASEAAILDEQTARANGDLAEATQRNALAVQMRGDNTGTDLNTLTSGLLYQERIARVTATDALSQQITLLSAGAGEQFDWSNIWYFDSSIEGWTGISTPTVSGGWLKPVGGPAVTSPSGLAIDASKYTQIRLRVRKTGTLTWSGAVSWNGGSTTVAEPTYDSNGIGLVTINPAWTGTIDYVSFSGYTTQGTSSNYYELDWVAIGRPSPGASSAQLFNEQLARANADEALASDITVLNASVGATNAAISSEAIARATADTALSTQSTTLSAQIGASQAAIQAEVTARATADEATASQTQIIGSALGANTAAITQEAATRATADSASATQIQAMTASIGDVQAGLVVERDVRAAGDASLSSQTVSFTAANSQAQAALIVEQAARVDADQATSAQVTTLSATTGANTAGILSEQQARTTADEASAGQVQTLVASVTGSTAALQTEQTVRATADSATVTQVQTLSATQGDNRAAIQTEQTTRTTADSALATETRTLAAGMAGVTSVILSEQTVRAEADLALASTTNTLATSVGTLSSSIVNQETAIATLTEASAQSSKTLVSVSKELEDIGEDLGEAALRNALSVDTETNERISTIAIAKQELTTAIEEGISAEASARLTLVAVVNDNRAAFDSYQLVQSDVNSATATQSELLYAAFGENMGAIASESEARATADSVTVTQTETLSASMGESIGMIESERLIRLSENEAFASKTETISASLGDNTSAIVSEATARVTAESASASKLDTMSVVFQENVAGIREVSEVSASATSALASQVTTLSASTDQGFAAIEEGYYTKIDADGAIATANTLLKAEMEGPTGSVGTVSAQVSNVESSKIGYCTIGGVTSDQTTRQACEAAGGFWNVGIPLSTAVKQVAVTDANGSIAAVEQAFSAQKTLNDGLKAQYTVKVDVNGHVSGFGLSTTANNAAPFSEFIIKADQFAIAPVSTDNTANDGSPFFHRTSATTINGVSVPAGTYMKAAYIHDATITNAKIANLAVDNAKIADLNVDKLNAGSLKVGSHIQSTNFVNGVSGWIIGANGSAEFASSSIRGKLTASQIDSRGLEIRDASDNVLFSATQNLDLSRVANKGAFASLSQITPANVGTYIASAAIGNAYIADAAITSAKIGNLEVDTIKLAYNSISTIDHWQGSGSQQSTTTNNAYVIFESPYYTIETGGNILVDAYIYGGVAYTALDPQAGFWAGVEIWVYGTGNVAASGDIYSHYPAGGGGRIPRSVFWSNNFGGTVSALVRLYLRNYDPSGTGRLLTLSPNASGAYIFRAKR